ncbi:MAG: ATP-binding cassette domain-containing protein [Acidovorax sp.]
MLRAIDVKVAFPRKREGLFKPVPPPVAAVNGVSLEIAKGETLGLVGESGCGKSTLARSLMQLVRPTAGQVLFDGVDLCGLSEQQLRPYRRRIQMVFQDPFSSLNPRMTVGQAVAEPLIVQNLAPRHALAGRVAELFATVGLSASMMGRYPHEFSGGQRQRVGIARALAAQPELLICDEPVSALDVSIQAQVVNLFAQLREQLGLAYLFVSHDLAVVRHLSDRIAVMYLGRIVEVARKDDLYRRPAHPYTRLLIDTIPTTRRALEKNRPPTPLRGELPSPLNPPAGCGFHPRCPHALDICRTQPPALTQRPDGRHVACHLPGDGPDGGIPISIAKV